MMKRESPYSYLIERSKRTRKYNEQWEQLTGNLIGGSLLAVQSSVLRGPGDDGADAIANHALDHLFARRDVEAFGGRAAASVLAGLLRQFGSEDARRTTVILAKPQSLQLMRDYSGSRVSPVMVSQHVTDRPKMSLFEAGLKDHNLTIPFRGTRYSGIKFGHRELRTTEPMVITTRERGMVDGRTQYTGTQSLFTYANPDDWERVSKGTTSAPEVPRRSDPDGSVVTIAIPTLTVFQLRPRRGRFTNVRMAVSCAPTGSHVVGMTTKTSDLDDFLQFYPPEFEGALQRALRG